MTSQRRWWRATIRVRLTLLYAGAFFLAGAALVALMYLFMAQALDRQQTARLGVTEHLSAQPSGQPDSTRAAHKLQDDLRTQFRKDRDDTLNAMLVASLSALGAVGVIAAGFGWLLAGRALHPLQQITATARRVAEGSLHERIAFDGPHDEVKNLADTFDAMLERLDRAFDSQRRFVANASHELRTPLTINRTHPGAKRSTARRGGTGDDVGLARLELVGMAGDEPVDGAFWGLIIWGIVALFRGSGWNWPRNDRPDPEQILAERFAKGEIDEEEYQRRLEILRSTGERAWERQR